jgi:hypothetical protein
VFSVSRIYLCTTFNGYFIAFGLIRFRDSLLAEYHLLIYFEISVVDDHTIRNHAMQQKTNNKGSHVMPILCKVNYELYSLIKAENIDVLNMKILKKLRCAL